MNDSGEAVRPLVRRYGVEPEQLVVVHDELDLPVAALQVKSGGGLAGHNGLRSIVAHLHMRRRSSGCASAWASRSSKEQGADHVLRRFSKRERAEIDVTVEQAADAVETIAADGVDAAMNRFNARRNRLSVDVSLTGSDARSDRVPGVDARPMTDDDPTTALRSPNWRRSSPRSRRCAPSSAASPSSPCPTPARALFVAALARVTTRRPVVVAVPTGAEAERLGARPRRSSSGLTRSSCSRRGRRCRSSGCRRRSRPWAGASGPCGGCMRVASTCPTVARRAGPRARAAARPPRRGRRAGARSGRGDAPRPRRAGRPPRRRRLPARVPGRGARRGRGAGLDRRRVPQSPPTIRSASTSGATRSTGSRRSRSPTSARPTSSTTPGSSRRASCCRPTRCGRAPRGSSRASRGGASSGSAWPRARSFDGMESWLPWLSEREHLLPDLLPADALVLLVEPKRMRDRAQELLDEEAALGGTLATTWGATADRAFPRLSLPFDRLLAHTAAGAVAVLAAPEGPDTPRLAATGSTRSSATPRVSPTACVRLRRDGYRVVLAADGAGSAGRLRDVLAGGGDVVDRRPDRRRAPRAGRRRPAARSSRSSPRPTSPVAAGCTGAPRRRARSGVPTSTTRSNRATSSCTTMHGVGRYAGMVESRDRRRRTRLPAARVQGRRQALRADRPGRHRAPLHRRRQPRPHRMGGADWEKTRARVRPAVQRDRPGARGPVPAAAGDAGPRLPARHPVAARGRGGVPIRGDARPGPRHRGGQGRHGAAGPDGPAGVRRRRLRQDRGRGACRVQGRAGRQAGRGAGAHDAARQPARPDVPRALRQLPGAGRGAVALPHDRASRPRSWPASPTARSTW